MLVNSYLFAKAATGGHNTSVVLQSMNILSTGANSNAFITTVNVGSTIFVIEKFQSYFAGVNLSSTCSDNVNGNYIVDTSLDATGLVGQDCIIKVFRSPVKTVAGTLNVAVQCADPNSGNYEYYFQLVEVSNLTNASPDQISTVNTGSGGDNAGPFFCSTTGTLSQANNFVFALLGASGDDIASGNVAPQPATGYIQINDDRGYDSGGYISAHFFDYKNVNSTTAVSANWTGNGSANGPWVSAILVYQNT